MGGNAFEDTEPLTPEEYETIVKEIFNIIQTLCVKVQPYIPLPEKEVHGDIDFLVILKPNYTLRDIQEQLHIENDKFLINNNFTANSVYRNKQVDFNAAANDHQFQLCRFYKSYGGIGAFLGLFLPSKFVKLNETGIVCCAYHEHIKLEYVVCDNINHILIFYGLDPNRYFQGFQTRKELFIYLRNLRFLDELKFINHTTKHQTKIMKAFQQYLKQEGPRSNENYVQFEDPLQTTLNYFKKSEQFDTAWKQKLHEEQRKKNRQGKWNGMHIMKIFEVESKKVNGYKKQFESNFGSRAQYQKYIEQTSFEEIIQLFSKICKLQPISPPK